MRLEFTKMEGAGNDFAVFAPTSHIDFTPSMAARLCDRRRGIGADGLMILHSLGPSKLRMEFFNSDGSRASMCGNGLRCAARFAVERMGAGRCPTFETDAGELSAKLLDDGRVRISVPVRKQFHEVATEFGQLWWGDTGVPHAVLLVERAETTDVAGLGQRLRRHPAFGPEGANVDFVEIPEEESAPCVLRTFERGVEGETLACGTGACAAAMAVRLARGRRNLSFITRGGDILEVDIPPAENMVKEMFLTGPAQFVFDGAVELEFPPS